MAGIGWISSPRRAVSMIREMRFAAGGQQLPVGVDRGGYRLVAEPGLDMRQRRSAGDEPRHVRVPEVMEAERRHTQLLDHAHQRRPDALVEVGVVQGQPGRSQEVEVIRRPTPGQNSRAAATIAQKPSARARFRASAPAPNVSLCNLPVRLPPSHQRSVRGGT